MPISIAGKRIIVTGGARGIAAAAVHELAREGAHVTSFDISDEAGKQVAAEATAAGPGEAEYRHVDVSNREAIFEATSQAAASMGGLDAVLAIAGVEMGARVEDITEEQWDRTFDINVKGVVFANQAAFAYLKDNGGSIVNFGSDAALHPYPNGAHYSASKGAVISFTRTVAGEWGQYGIRANTLVPAIWTPMYDGHRERMSETELAHHDEVMRQKIYLGGRLGDPTKDLAPVLMFLVSDASRFITAQIISVNGGNEQVR